MKCGHDLDLLLKLVGEVLNPLLASPARGDKRSRSTDEGLKGKGGGGGHKGKSSFLSKSQARSREAQARRDTARRIDDAKRAGREGRAFGWAEGKGPKDFLHMVVDAVTVGTTAAAAPCGEGGGAGDSDTAGVHAVSEASMRPKLRLCVMGGDHEVHRLLCALVGLQHLYGDVLRDHVDIQVYLVPLERSDLASYLAQRDSWYRQHVLLPFAVGVPMCPAPVLAPGDDNGGGGGAQGGEAAAIGARLESTGGSGRRSRSAEGGFVAPSLSSRFLGGIGKSPNKNGGQGGGVGGIVDSPPGSPHGGQKAGPARASLKMPGFESGRFPPPRLHTLLQNYMREANETLSIPVSECEIWTCARGNNTVADFTVPFLARAEIGLNVLVAEFRKTYDTGNSDWEDVLQSKLFRADLQRQQDERIDLPLEVKYTEHHDDAARGPHSTGERMLQVRVREGCGGRCGG